MRDDFSIRMDPNTETNRFSLIQSSVLHGKVFLDQSVQSKVKVKSKAREQDVVVQRDILGLLAAKSQEMQGSVDINKAPQPPFHLCLYV